eukprot:scaffold939_cov303-Pavlova_lutheri.AAC.1
MKCGWVRVERTWPLQWGTTLHLVIQPNLRPSLLPSHPSTKMPRNPTSDGKNDHLVKRSNRQQCAHVRDCRTITDGASSEQTRNAIHRVRASPVNPNFPFLGRLSTTPSDTERRSSLASWRVADGTTPMDDRRDRSRGAIPC